MNILPPVIPDAITQPGDVPVVMPPNNFDPVTAVAPPDWAGSYMPPTFRAPNGGVYAVMPIKIVHDVRLAGCVSYWSSEAGDYVLPVPPNFNSIAIQMRHLDGHLEQLYNLGLRFEYDVDIPAGWGQCAVPPEGFEWPIDTPDGSRGSTAYHLAGTYIPDVGNIINWPLLQAITPHTELLTGADKEYYDIGYYVTFAVFARSVTVSERGRRAAAGVVPIACALFGLASLLCSVANPLTTSRRRHGKKRPG